MMLAHLGGGLASRCCRTRAISCARSRTRSCRARSSAAFILAQGAKSVYLIMPQTPFTETVFKAIRETVEPKGVKVDSVIIDGKKTSFRSEIDEMVRANPDLFMMGGYHGREHRDGEGPVPRQLQGQGDGLRLRHHAGLHRRRRQGSRRRHVLRAPSPSPAGGSSRLCEAQGAGEARPARYLHLPGLRPRQSGDPRDGQGQGRDRHRRSATTSARSPTTKRR